MTVKALSIKQPWSWLIVNSLKDIENREWTTSYRGLVLIHAGKQKDRSCFLYEYGGSGSTLDPRLHWTLDDRIPQWDYHYQYGGIIGYATLTQVVTHHTSPWFVGTYGFVLTDCHTLPFIPLRGQLGLFNVSGEVEDQVKQLKKEGK